jgi:hypothetical protein
VETKSGLLYSQNRAMEHYLEPDESSYILAFYTEFELNIVILFKSTSPNLLSGHMFEVYN